MSIRFSQYQLYHNHEFRGIVEMAAIYRADLILAEARFEGDEARRAMADDLVNGTYGLRSEALARLARLFMTNGDLINQAITQNVIHVGAVEDSLIDYLTDVHWATVAAALYSGAISPVAP